jgi:carbohydrate-binding DOMON domain-containing protein
MVLWRSQEESAMTVLLLALMAGLAAALLAARRTF